jgi:sirohydrochlorin ferrochelatase
VKSALLIVDHGSRRPDAHVHLLWVAEQVRRRRPGLPVYLAHMELAAPSIQQAVEACAADGVEDLIVHPFFLVPGLHAADDVPRLVAAAALAHPRMRVRVTEATGSVAGIADLILATISTD